MTIFTKIQLVITQLITYLLLCNFAYAYPQYGTYIIVEGQALLNSKQYTPIISDLVESSPTATDRVTIAPASNEQQMRKFTGKGIGGHVGYNFGGGFAIELVGKYQYRDDFVDIKDSSSSIILKNQLLKGYVNVVYEHSIGRTIKPYIAVGIGADFRKFEINYEALASGSSEMVSNAPTSVFADEIQTNYFAFQVQLGVTAMVADNAGFILGFVYEGSRDINIARDNVPRIEVNLPTEKDAGGKQIETIKNKMVPKERLYLKNMEYGNQALILGVKIYF